MAYVLQAIVGKSIKELSGHFGLHVIQMPLDFFMCPLDDNSRKRMEIPLYPFADEDEDVVKIPVSLHNLCVGMSDDGPIAYLEAEIFGGDGMQAGILYDRGQLVEGPIRGRNAIDETLAKLGVIRQGMRDEFDMLGLGRHRFTEDWIKANNDAN